MKPSQRTRFEDSSASSSTFIMFEIKRSDILVNNKKPFLEFWNIGRISKAGRLHDMFNKVLFCVGGYNDDARALFEIPEVRTFLRELAHEWPYFFYADNLQADFLIQVMQCLISNLTVAYTDKSPANYVSKVKPDEMNQAYRVLLDGLVHISPMDDQMNQTKFDARVEAIQNHLRKEFLQ